ncbi:MAG: glycosyltransferase [Anaerolineaceae bacterium]|nr:glycosyltransferase [Anaerolineaceae bacterium]
MHILYLVPHVPNPTKIRSHFQVRGLLDAGHRVTVVTLNRSELDAKNITKLNQTGAKVISVRLSKYQSLWNALKTLPTRLPLQSRFMWSAELMEKIQDVLKSDPPDVIHIEHLRMACYGLQLMPDWPTVWDAVDYLSALYQQAGHFSVNWITRQIYAIEAPRLQSYERWLSTQFPATLVISTKDQSLFQENHPQPDRVHYQPQGLPVTALDTTIERDTKTLAITGTLNYHPNVASVHYFVREILPLVQRQIPDIQLQLVGANPDESIKALTNDTIKITGFVPSITDYLQRSTIALAPVTYGSGIQIKVLEAFLTATPLVATSVALRGLDVQHERQVLIADTPDDYANAVLRLLADPELRRRIGEAGRKYVEQNHDLRVTTTHMVEIYKQVIAEKHNPIS